MNSNLLVILSIIISALGLALAIYASIMLKKIQSIKTNLSIDSVDSNLEEILSAVASKIKKLEGKTESLARDLQTIDAFSKLSLHKIGLHKFNAYEGEGGNLSFCIALLNNHNTGIILSAMNGRSQHRLYIKPIVNGRSEITLTTEEESTLQKAQQNKNIS